MGLGRVAHGDIDEMKMIKMEPPPYPSVSPQPEPEGEQGWSDLLYDFTQDATLHGLRYVTLKNSYALRRILWLLVVLGALIALVYAIISQLMFLMTMPKAVNVEVIYNDSLIFPTITICNQNFFRGSETFQMGLYDQVNDRFSLTDSIYQTSAPNNGTCTEGEFTYYEGQFVTKEAVYKPLNISTDSYFATYEQITLHVCKQICLTYHSATCNAFAYQRSQKRCSLTMLTPSLIPVPSDVNSTFVHRDPNVDMYDRRRCFGLRKTTCDFENGLCEFYKEQRMVSRWLSHSGSTSTPDTGPSTDHTKVIGYYMYVEPVIGQSSESPDNTSLITPFVSSTESLICISFAYSLVGLASDLGTLRISRRSPLGTSQLLWAVAGRTDSDWEVDLVNAGTGLFQIVITVEAGKQSLGDVAIDDVSIGPCSDFVEECRRTVKGNTYIGTKSITASGQACVPWNETFSLWGRNQTFNFPIEPHSGDAYCRNPNNDPNGPWCYVITSPSLYSPAYCDIPFCECTSSEYKCTNGMCVHQLLTCNGVDDCGDGSDETVGCVISPTCTFEKGNVCGYNLDPYSLVSKGKSTWLRYKGQIRNGNLKRDHTLDSKLGHFLYLDSGSVTLAYKERVATGSPLVAATNASQCLRFYLYNKRDVIFPDAMGNLRVFQRFGKYYRRQVAIFSGTNVNGWMLKKVEIPKASLDFNITFEAAIGYSYYSDMAIDDVELSDGYCSTPDPNVFCIYGYHACGGRCVTACDGVGGCADFADEDPENCDIKYDPLICYFTEPYVCGYQDDSNPDNNGWEKLTDDESVSVYDEEPGLESVKRFVSRRFALPSDSCLRFRYTANSYSHYCLLSIYQEKLNNRTLLHKVGASTIGEGRTAFYEQEVTVTAMDDMALAFEANCSTLSDKIEMQISEVVFVTSTCEELLDTKDIICQFSNKETCGYLDISQEGVTWVPSAEPLAMVARLPAFANVDSATTLLLFPTLTIHNESCVTMQLAITGLIEGQIVEYQQPDTVYYAVNGYGLSQAFSMEAGVYRLLLRAKISKGGSLELKSVSHTTDNCSPSYGGNSEHRPEERDPISEKNSASRPEVDSSVKVVVEPEPIAYTPEESLPKAILNNSIHLYCLGAEENLTKYYRAAGHQVTRLIYRCHWSGQPCSAANFTSQITDFGYCHTFNPGTEGYPVLKTASTGSSAGLRLILNVEQYDYMNGPQSDAGVKIFLSAADEVPQVKDLGFAAGPGDHAFVAVKLSQSEGLKQPWGTCGSQELEYGDAYTYSACLRECETKTMVEACGCRDAYMPYRTEDDPPICNITQYLNCAVHTAATFGDMSLKCNCTEPCHRDIYETQVSYASLSRLSVNQLLTSDLDQLNTTHREALEVNQRADSIAIGQDLKLFNDIDVSYNELLTYAFHEAWYPQQSFVIKVENSLSYFLNNILMSDISDTVVNRLSAYKAEFDDAYGAIYSAVQSLNTSFLADMDILERLYDDFVTGTDKRTQIDNQTDRVDYSLTQLQLAIDDFYYAFRAQQIVYDSYGIIMKINSHYLPTTINVLKENCEETVDSLSHKTLLAILTDIRSTTKVTVTTQTNKDGKETTVVKKADGEVSILNSLIQARQDYQSKLKNVQTCLSEYVTFLQQVDDWYTISKASIDRLKSLMTMTVSTATVNDLIDYVDETEVLTDFQASVADLSSQFNKGIVTKEVIGLVFDSANTTIAVQNVNTFMSRVSSRLIEPKRTMITNFKALVAETYKELVIKEMNFSAFFDNTYSSLAVRSLKLWKRPKANIDDYQNPHYANDTFQLGDIQRFIDIHSPKVLNELADWYTQPLQQAINAFEMKIRMYKNLVVTALENMQAEAEAFKQQTVLGADFIKENFIAVDIFFAQLKYERTEQIKAYDIESFFGDVGGFMGLLLGASCLSVIEILDLVFYNCIRKFRHYRKNTPKTIHVKESQNLSSIA